MKWKSSPEFKAIQKEFIESFEERRNILASVINELTVNAPIRSRSLPEILYQLRLVAHKLGGVAKVYQFPTLGQIGSKLDKVLSQTLDTPEALQEEPHARDFLNLALFLDKALSEAASGLDPSHLAASRQMNVLEILYDAAAAQGRET